MTEVMKPEAQAVAEALQQEIEVAAIKVEMSMGKIMKPMIKYLEHDLETYTYDEDC